METSLEIYFGAPVASLMLLKSNYWWLAMGDQISALHVLEMIKKKKSHSAVPRLFDKAQIHCIFSLPIAYFQILFYSLIELLLDSEELKSFSKV